MRELIVIDSAYIQWLESNAWSLIEFFDDEFNDELMNLIIDVCDGLASIDKFITYWSEHCIVESDASNADKITVYSPKGFELL